MPAYSFDDKTWKKFEGCSFLVNTQMVVGLALCSGDPSNRVKVRFMDVSPKNDSVNKK
jgi:regulation of enolase protein 1 (concanavalin A-like superfamily)